MKSKNNGRGQGATSLRKRAEARIKAVSPERRAKLSATETRRLLHELEVHQIELEIQNEELRRTHQELEETIGRYTDLYDFAPLGYVTLNQKGVIHQVNLAGASLLGLERSKLLKKPFVRFLPDESHLQFRALLTRAFATKELEVGELSLSPEGKPPVIVHLRACVTPEGHECRLVMTDITAHSRLERERELSLSVLDRINSSTDLPALLREVTLLLREGIGCEAVGIRLRDGEDYPYFETVGFPAAFVRAESKLCAADGEGALLRDRLGRPMLECMCGNILCGRFDPSQPMFTPQGSFWTNSTTRLLASTTEADRQTRTRNRCHGEGYESAALIPLRTAGATFGLIQCNDKRPNRFTPEKILLLERIGDQLAAAVAHSQAEKALREAVQFKEQIISHVQEGVVVYGLDLRYRLWNPFMERLTGLPAGQVLGRHPLEVFPFLSEVGGLSPVERAVGGEVAGAIEYPFHILATGRQGWASKTAGPLRNTAGAVIGVIAVVRDITDQKKADEEVQRLSRWLLRTQSISKVGGWAINLETGEVWVSPEARRIYGIGEEALSITRVQSFPLPECRPMLDQALHELINSGKPYQVKFQVRRGTDGHIVDIHSVAEYRQEEALLLGVIEDITERKRAEALIRDLALFPTRNPEPVIRVDTNGVVTLTNSAAERFGIHTGGWIGDLLPDLSTIDWSRCIASKQRLVRELTVSGRVLRFTIQGEAQPDMAQLFGADITELKRAQDDLRESEARYRSLFEVESDAILLVDRTTGQFIDANPAALRLYGYDREEFLSLKARDISTEPEKTSQAIATGQLFVPVRWHRKKDGTTVPVEISGDYFNSGKQEVHVGVIRDITERKRAEAKLSRSEERLSLAQKAGHVGVFDWDLTTNDAVWTPELEETFGLAHGTFENRYEAWTKRVHPEDLPRLETMFAAWLKSDQDVQQWEYRYLRHGEVRWILARGEVFRDPTGKPVRMIGTNLDITQLKAHEQKMVEYQRQLRSLASELSRVEQQERRQLASVLHDDVIQMLALCRIKLGALLESFQGAEQKGFVEGARALIEQAIQSTRSLTFQLSPPILHELGLDPGLDWLTEQFARQHGLPCQFQSDAQPKPLAEDLAEVLFRAVRELLVNVVKHSRATRVEVRSSLEGAAICLQVTDDGVGFDAAIAACSAGKNGGFGLFNIRERLAYLGGSCDLHTKPGGGASVTLRAPLKPETTP